MFKNPKHIVSDVAQTFETMRPATRRAYPYSQSMAALSALRTLIGRDVPVTAPYLDEPHVDNDTDTSLVLPTIRTVTMPTEKVEKRA